MIRLHDFNTRWWGKAVGIVDDPLFFRLQSAEQHSLLADYAWTEFKSPLQNAPRLHDVQRAGFFLADMQLSFRIALNVSQPRPCAPALAIQFADENGFSIGPDEMAPFAHERFLQIPGCDLARVNSRYALWAELLIEASPGTCLEVRVEGRTQGWFLSRPGPGRTLNLTLAMLHRASSISGLALYEAGLSAYAQRGHRIGWATFSATNTAVHNIYSNLGARFVQPEGNWLHVGNCVPGIGNSADDVHQRRPR